MKLTRCLRDQTYSFTRPYHQNGSSGTAQLLFWSVTDGMNGYVLPPGTGPNGPYVPIPVALTITAWYFPISGPLGFPPGTTAIIVDAFSANLGHVIDDTFVSVTSDPTLTNDANVIGEVPTTVAETLVANNSVTSTREPFAEWNLNRIFMPVGATTLNIERATSGIAIPFYQQPLSKFPSIRPLSLEPYYPWWIIELLMGRIPLERLLELMQPEPPPELRAALEMADIAERVSPQLRDDALDIASKQGSIAAKMFQDRIESLKKKPSEKT